MTRAHTHTDTDTDTPLDPALLSVVSASLSRASNELGGFVQLHHLPHPWRKKKKKKKEKELSTGTTGFADFIALIHQHT